MPSAADARRASAAGGGLAAGNSSMGGARVRLHEVRLSTAPGFRLTAAGDLHYVEGAKRE